MMYALGDPVYVLKLSKREQTDLACTLNDVHYRGLGNWSAHRDVVNPYPFMPHYPLELLSAKAFNSQLEPAIRECHTPSTVNVADPLWRRSLCPWYWKENYDSQRVPRVLLEAHCQCDKATVTLPGPEGLRATYECEKVFYKVRVLKLDDKCSYYQAYEEIAIACATLISGWRPAYKGHHVIMDDMPNVSSIETETLLYEIIIPIAFCQ